MEANVQDGRDKFLYRVKNKLGSFYVVAHDWNEAAGKLTTKMSQANYGAYGEREAVSMEIVAMQSFFNEKLHFSSDIPALIVD